MNVTGTDPFAWERGIQMLNFLTNYTVKTHKVVNEVNLEKLDGIGPSREFP